VTSGVGGGVGAPDGHGRGPRVLLAFQEGHDVPRYWALLKGKGTSMCSARCQRTQQEGAGSVIADIACASSVGTATCGRSTIHHNPCVSSRDLIATSGRPAILVHSPPGTSFEIGAVVLGATVVSGTVGRGRLVVTVVSGSSGSRTIDDGGDCTSVAACVGSGGGSSWDPTGVSAGSSAGSARSSKREGPESGWARGGTLVAAVVTGMVAAIATGDGAGDGAAGTSPLSESAGGEVTTVVREVLGALETVDVGLVDVGWPAASMCWKALSGGVFG
jgi:hypothetical protein